MADNTDQNFRKQKHSLMEELQNIADFLGDEDAKKVKLRYTELQRTLSTQSANAERASEDYEQEA